jgi:hypothetical protein
MPVLYAAISDLRTVLSGTDGGQGTGAQLTDAQLTLAMTAASDRISMYAGTVYDGSTLAAAPPPGFGSLALDLAAFWAYKTYLKSKDLGPQHPVWLAYTEAMSILKGWRDGTLQPDPQVPGSVGQEAGMIINRIPNIFTGNDSNTRFNPGTGTIEPDAPDDMLGPQSLGFAPW